MGSLVRSDGTKQLTLAGIPVYWYSKDVKPGQVNGEGVNGTQEQHCFSSAHHFPSAPHRYSGRSLLRQPR